MEFLIGYICKGEKVKRAMRAHPVVEPKSYVLTITRSPLDLMTCLLLATRNVPPEGGRLRAFWEGIARGETIFLREHFGPGSMRINMKSENKFRHESAILSFQVKNAQAPIKPRLADICPFNEVHSLSITRMTPNKVSNDSLHGLAQTNGEKGILHDIDRDS